MERETVQSKACIDRNPPVRCVEEDECTENTEVSDKTEEGSVGDGDSEYQYGLRTTSRSAYTKSVHRALTLKSRELLRGIPLAGVLHGLGRVLRSSTGTASDFDLSSPVRQLDAFLSHTWASPRFKKYLTLMVYYNLVPAFIAGICSAALTCALIGLGLLSPTPICGHPEGRLCELVGDITFVITLLNWHEIIRFCGCPGPSVFLDKACVHQTDEVLKRQGIKSLAAYLTSAKSLIVLYSDIYLERLWTVYELASFLLLGSRENLEILPIEIPLVLLATMSLLPLRHLLEFIASDVMAASCLSTDWWPNRLHSSRLLHELVMAFLFTRWVRILRLMQDKLENFDIRKAKCAVDADRPLVQSNVEAFVKHIGKVSPTASQMEALEAFNDLVRKVVPDLIRPSLGAQGIRYKVALVIFLHQFHWFDYLAHAWVNGHGSAQTLVTLLRYLVLDWAGHPLQVAMAVYCASAVAHFSGAAGIATTVASILAVAVGAEGEIAVRRHVFTYAKGRNYDQGGLVVVILYSILLCLLTYVVYRRRTGLTDLHAIDVKNGEDSSSAVQDESSDAESTSNSSTSEAV